MAMTSICKRSPLLKVPVFLLKGIGVQSWIDFLLEDKRFDLVSSPRHADLLLLAGHFPPSLQKAAAQVHDQVPKPRASVLLQETSERAFLPHANQVQGYPPEQALDSIVEIWDDLIHHRSDSYPNLGLKENPVKWKGVGPHGQGGKGMMGGVPYGRPMPMTSPDLRDGLELGDNKYVLGPFIPWLPPALRLEIEFKGDVIQSLKPLVPQLHPVTDLFKFALYERLPVARLEKERANAHLRTNANLFHHLGLRRLAQRTREIVHLTGVDQVRKIKALSKSLNRNSGFHLATAGIGYIDPALTKGLGTIARAAGIPEDCRTEDDGYRKYKFNPIVQQSSDVKARCIQRLEETIQSLEIANSAGALIREPGPPVEGLHGRLPSLHRITWVNLIEKTARGMAWDDFIPFLISLDVDPTELPATERYNDCDFAKTQN